MRVRAARVVEWVRLSVVLAGAAWMAGRLSPAMAGLRARLLRRSGR